MPDWEKIMVEYKDGSLSRLEICQKYEINIVELKKYALQHDVDYGGAPLQKILVGGKDISQILLDNSEIVAEPKDRVNSISRSQLLSARGLHQRTQNLFLKFDQAKRDLLDSTILNEQGEEVINVKALAVLTNILETLSRVVERSCRIESSTFALASGDVGSNQAVTVRVIGGLQGIENGTT